MVLLRRVRFSALVVSVRRPNCPLQPVRIGGDTRGEWTLPRDPRDWILHERCRCGEPEQLLRAIAWAQHAERRTLYVRLPQSVAGRQYRSARRSSHSRRDRFPSRGNDGLDAGNGRSKCGALRLTSEDGSSRAWFAVRRFALAAPLSPYNLVERLTSTGLARARCSRASGLHRAGTAVASNCVVYRQSDALLCGRLCSGYAATSGTTALTERSGNCIAPSDEYVGNTQ